jgi:hypothetical protein
MPCCIVSSLLFLMLACKLSEQFFTETKGQKLRATWLKTPCVNEISCGADFLSRTSRVLFVKRSPYSCARTRVSHLEMEEDSSK